MKVRPEYETWLEKSAKGDKVMDLPDFVVKVPRDEAETSVPMDDW